MNSASWCELLYIFETKGRWRKAFTGQLLKQPY